MKRIAYSLLATLALSVPSQAIVGGPFDNNLFFGRELNATFQGTMVGKNISGVMVFGTTSTSQPTGGSASELVGIYGNDGRFVTFVEGTMVVGGVTATANFPAHNLSAALSGSQLRGMSIVGEVYRSSYSYKDSPTEGVSEEVEYDQVSFEVHDVVNISGTFDAKFVQTFPSIVYSGQGELLIRSLDGVDREEEARDGDNVYVFSYVPVIKEEKVDIRVNGIRTSNSQPFFGNTLPPVEAPGVYPIGTSSN